MDGGDQVVFGVVGGHVGDVLDVSPNEVVHRVQVRGGGGTDRRVQSRSIPSEAKSGSLWTCGPASSLAATPRVCHLPPDCIRGSRTLFSTSRYTLVLTFKPTSKMFGGMMWPSLETTPRTITVAG